MDEWKVSLHGGHCGEFCDHAGGTLREMLEAAVAFGYRTFGVSEHAPRSEPRFLYAEERALGWTVETLAANFERYQAAVNTLAREFAGRLTVLRGFECEVVPAADWLAETQAIRARRLQDGTPAFDYCVGSVHYVEELQVDGPPADFAEAAAALGGLEAFAVRYYESVAAMARALRPEVVGHLDLVKRNVAAAGLNPAELQTDRVRAAARAALESVREAGAILDLNTAGWRKGLGEPYPAPWLVREAHALGVPFCFGDDSHRPTDVGSGIEQAREYLLANGVPSVTLITRSGAVGERIVRQSAALS